MRARTPFWPLLKNELALGRYGGTGPAASLLLLYWLGVGVSPLLVLFLDNSSRGNFASLFEAGFLPVIVFLFLSGLTVWMTYATVPAFSELLSPGGAIPGAVQHTGAFEFILTRAVDRRVLFRARSTALFLFAVAPFLLNVLVSPLAPDVRFAPADSASTEALRRQGQYLGAFPASHSLTNFTVGAPGPLVISHGGVAYTTWLTWSAVLAFLLLQGYGIWIARRVNSNCSWSVLFPGAPIILFLSLLILAARASRTNHINIYENCFLFFSTHPLGMVISLAALAVAIQIWCERKFSELEIL